MQGIFVARILYLRNGSPLFMKALKILCKLLWHSSALILCVAFVLAWTSIPSRAIGWLALRDVRAETMPPPKHIVVLGGGGIPSQSGLMRTYAGASLHPKFPNATWWVSLPADDDPETDSVGLMKQELILRGVPSDQIDMEHTARNTYEQAVEMRKLIGDIEAAEPLMIVTSAPHMRRAVAAFEKQGFTDVWPHTAKEQDLEADVGPYVRVRYSFWQNLEAEVRFARECVALLVYRLRGWI